MTQRPAVDGDRLLAQLAVGRGRFLAFVRRRIADPELAEDVLQASLVKAVEGLSRLSGEDKLIPWFYRILRNAIVDAYRSLRTNERNVDLTRAADVTEDEEDEPSLCHCFEPLIHALKDEYAEVIRLLDLEGRPTDAVAKRLGISATNLKVRRHRARAALRSLLQDTCRVCAEHHCLDCTCRAARSPSPPL